MSPDVSEDVTAMIEAMREALDSGGVELTRDAIEVAALAGFAALTEPGRILSSTNPIEVEVRKAITFFRAEEPMPPLWAPERWVNAVSAKLGQSAHIAGHLLDVEAPEPEMEAALIEEFEQMMVGVAAAAQEAALSTRERRLADGA